jgi:hypothetical protein
MNTSVAAINERDFAAHLVDDGSDPSRPSDNGGTVDDGARSTGEQLLRRLFHPQVDGQSAAAQQTPAAPAHRFDAQDLYVGGQPKATDIDQDNLGDCYFVATLGALADRQPDRIKNAIQFDPATGNYTVTLHKQEWGWLPPGFQDKEVKVQVTQQEVEDNLKRHGGSTVDNNPGTDKPIWPAVMETAYAKMHDDNPGDGLAQGYREIDGGKAYDAMYALTGTEGENIKPTGFGSEIDAQMMEKQISKALGEGKAVTLSTDPESRGLWDVITGGKGKQDGLVDNHVYMVERVYKDSNGEVKVELRNPWANNNNVGEGKDSPNATITVNLKDLIDTGGLEYVNVGPGK